nr:zinc finger, C2H2 [Tanacetum cinerariifolium]GEX71891.1 zinc finger, C2H2 [Tanacetum cinerariifolium]
MFQEKLARESRGMSKAKMLGFMKSLQGQGFGRSERTKVVNADVILKLLPENWKAEIAVHRLAGQTSLYCRNYVSPSGIEFKSCKDVAVFLRDQSSRQMKNMDEVASSSVHEANNNVPAPSYLHDVEVVSLIECSPCGLTFEDFGGLEKHLAIVHKNTIRRFNLPTVTQRSEKVAIADLDEPLLDVAQAQQNGKAYDQPSLKQTHEQQNGQAFDRRNLNKSHPQQNEKPPSSSQHSSIPQVSIPIINGNSRFETHCTWCKKEFLYEPIDLEIMTEAREFMCRKCKQKICGVLERSLLRNCQK